ncbi:arylesterase [Methylogaea oryzae]|uniref:Arylesterase n=1 Tax=Methylogaea oryzae TaxID=1295382 RepID=A0A8D4VM85_9GAMM|nr:arylesterase [Methylogaea oryzae]BBL69834.1 arylesterase [Methylogaea oryzae]
MGKFIVLLLAALAAVAPARAETVLLLGDSISAGYGLPTGRGWADLLRDKLKQAGGDYTLANASISGETSAGGLARIDQELSMHRPAIVILELGANDGLRGLPPAQLAANLEAIAQRSQAAGARVLLLGMRLPPNYGPRYLAAYADAYAALAKKLGLPFVPFLLEGFAEDPAWFQADGIHPNEAAQPLLAERVWQALQPLLPPPAAPAQAGRFKARR